MRSLESILRAGRKDKSKEHYLEKIVSYYQIIAVNECKKHVSLIKCSCRDMSVIRYSSN